jgi:putative glutamine amidotransferase
VQFKLLLEQHGYGSQISDLTLNFKQVPQGIDFTGCDFKRVTFLGELKFSIFDGYLEQVNFNQVNLYASNFNSETVLNKVKIQNSNFSYVVFEQAFLNETYFYYVDLSETIFNQAIILNSFASGSNFTDTTVNQSVVKHFIINNSILPTADNSYFQLSEIVPKRGPSIGILSSYQEIEMEANLGMSSASPYARIKQFGAIPVLLDFYALGFNETQLNLEVQDILNNLMLASETDALPLTIAQAVLQANTPTVASIKTYAEITMQSLDALWLPGGPDVAAEFYGHASQEAPNYLREVVEFALIEQAYFQEKPIIGVCHGSQIINVYFGGTLLEDVPGHWGVIQSLNPLQTQGILGEKIEGEILGVSVHHQAVGELADIFEPVLEYDGIIKASQTQSGSPILLFQFHPEYGLDENNLALLETFFDLASSPSVAPKLGDVLALNDIFADTVIPNGAPGLEPILPLDTESVEYLAPPTLNYPMLETEYIIYI